MTTFQIREESIRLLMESFFMILEVYAKLDRYKFTERLCQLSTLTMAKAAFSRE